MKALILLVTAAGLGTAGYLTGYTSLAPVPTKPAPGPVPPLPALPAPSEPTQPIQFVGGPNPPGGLPASLTCTVFVNGQTAGSFPFAWDGQGWQGVVSVGGSGGRRVFLRVLNGAQTPLPFAPGAFIVSPLSEPPVIETVYLSPAGYYGLFSLAPLRIEVQVSHEWKVFVGGRAVVFVFTG
jgi:hypothetical protein